MRPQSFYITDSASLRVALSYIAQAEMPFLVTFSKDRDRTSAQNRLLHKWFSEIAKQRGDTSKEDVKAECNRQYGFPILRRDNPVAKYVIEKAIDPLPYEKQLTLIKSGVVAVTSQMSVEQLSEYMSELSTEYRSRGFSLTEPTE
jgi:hypothetical protein